MRDKGRAPPPPLVVTLILAYSTRKWSQRLYAHHDSWFQFRSRILISEPKARMPIFLRGWQQSGSAGGGSSRV